MWVFSIDVTAAAIVPALLLGLIVSAFLVPVFTREVSSNRLFAAGVLAGIAGVFRYDIGIGLLGLNLVLIAIREFARHRGEPNRLRPLLKNCCRYLLGFALVVLPLSLWYLSVAAIHPFVNDVIIYSAKYYPHTRNLPFPKIRWSRLDNLEIYLPAAIAAVSLYAVAAHFWRIRRDEKLEEWNAFLLTFAGLTALMYSKGLIRVHPTHMYAAIVSSAPLLAVLYEYRSQLNRAARALALLLALFFFLTAGRSALRQTRLLYTQRLSVLQSIVMGSRASNDPGWCKFRSPLTVGVCFLPEDYRIRTIEFIIDHTRPDQTLFSGVPEHDRIYANDMLIYFATQRMPATRWAHFDPGLQNSYAVQAEMTRELDASAPPYIVLSRETELTREPNDSSKSTGVKLLDDYIANKYEPVLKFRMISIWQRRP